MLTIGVLVLADQLGSLQAALLILLLVGLGVPISWKKSVFGKTIPWLGLVPDLRIPAWL